MLSRVAILPQPPLLVPELVGGADADVTELRSACLDVVKALPPNWLAIGSDPHPRRIESAAGTFRGYGVDVRVELAEDSGPADPDLPLPALIAAWLRGQAGASTAVVDLIADDLPPADCAAHGARAADAAGLLILGDGSYRHGERAPGRPDDRAGHFDQAVAAALATVDLDALMALDPTEAAELGAVGRAPWQALAGAIRADGRPWRCVRSDLLIPFGVAYHVALWEPAE